MSSRRSYFDKFFKESQAKQALLAILGYGCIFLLSQIVLAMFIKVTRMQINEYERLLFFSTYLALILFLIRYLAQKYVQMMGSKKGLSPDLDGWLIIKGVVQMILIVVLCNSIMQSIYTESGTKNQALVKQLLVGNNIIYFAVIIAIIAPIIEELLFRGILLQKLTDLGCSSKWRLVISATIFSSVHASQNIISFLLFLLFGVVLARVYVRKYNLLNSMAVHIVYNIITILPVVVNHYL